MARNRQQQKQQFFEEMMRHDHVLVHFDTRKPGVSIPEHLANNPGLTLKLSYAFQGQTKHDDQTISAFLKFNGNYFECMIPWKAIWGITASTGKNAVWAEDMPKELVLKLAKEQLKQLGAKLFGAKKELSLPSEAPADSVPENEATPRDEESKPTNQEQKPKAHLRRVK